MSLVGPRPCLLNQLELIELREKSKKLTFIEGSLQNKEREVPEYIQLTIKIRLLN